MGKFKTFFKKQLSNLNDWFIKDNHWVSFMTGWIVYLLMVFVYGIWFVTPPVAPTIIGAYVATLAVMIAVEVKDKAWGAKFDFKAINAGMFLGNCLLIAYILTLIF